METESYGFGPWGGDGGEGPGKGGELPRQHSRLLSETRGCYGGPSGIPRWPHLSVARGMNRGGCTFLLLHLLLALLASLLWQRGPRLAVAHWMNSFRTRGIVQFFLHFLFALLSCLLVPEEKRAGREKMNHSPLFIQRATARR
jgi:hypothetical protein